MQDVEEKVSNKANGSLSNSWGTIFLLGLAGCGGGGGASVKSNVSSAIKSGFAIKGALEGAQAFIDVNQDGQHDSGDSNIVTTASDGSFSIPNPTNLVGDIVIITDENTIDNSSGSVLAGLTLKAPSSFGVVSPVTSLTTALIASGETLSDAESQIKTALGLNDQISLNSFNPFNDTTSNDSIEYEKTSQQVIAIVNALSEIEVASGVSKQGAMSNAVFALTKVVKVKVELNKTATVKTALNFKSDDLINRVVDQYKLSSSTFDAAVSGGGHSSSTLGGLKTAIKTVNSAIDTVDSITGSKRTFSIAQDTLKEMAKEATEGTTVSLTSVDQMAELIIFSSGGTAIIPENMPASSIVYKALAGDANPSNTPLYSLEGVDKDFFNINPNSGEVTLKASADAEDRAKYSITVRATKDHGETLRVATKDVTVNVTNVNEAPFIINPSLTETVFDGTSTSTVVFKANALDPEGQVIRYSLASGLDSTYFSIDADDGEVRFVESPIKSDKDSYRFNIVATDNNDPTKSSETRININVVDIPKYLLLETKSSTVGNRDSLEINVFVDFNEILDSSIDAWEGASFRITPTKGWAETFEPYNGNLTGSFFSLVLADSIALRTAAGAANSDINSPGIGNISIAVGEGFAKEDASLNFNGRLPIGTLKFNPIDSISDIDFMVSLGSLNMNDPNIIGQPNYTVDIL